MHVVIIGAGEVGTATASDLAADNDVVVVDTDPDRTEQLTYELDVLTLTGDGTSLEILEEADTANADMFIACTDEDRANLVSCATASTMGDAFTIARTKAVQYLRTWERDQSAFDVDFMVCSDLLTAENIVRVIGLPAAVDVDPFAGGLVQMAVFEIHGESPVAGQTVEEADRFDSLTFVGLFQDDDLLIPRGDTLIQADDRAVVIGSPSSVQAFAADIEPEATPSSADDIVIIGGSEIGYQTARLLGERSLNSRMIVEDPDRARFLAEKLPETTVLEHDATDTDFLEREYVDQADVVVAAKETDEENLLTSVLTKRLGVDRVVAVVNTADYVTLFEEIGIDVAINPREVTAEEITRFTFENVAENISVLEHDQAEVLELELTDASDLVGQTIQELSGEIDFPFVIGAITRHQDVVTPRGDTELLAGDHIIFFVETTYVEDVIGMV